MIAPVPPAAADAGFSLIEVLVAMAVLAVAAAGFVGATERHIDTIGGLERRAAGGWAADNALVAARLGATAAAEPLLGHDWRPTVATRRSADRDIAALTVTAGDGTVAVTLPGFRDAAAPAGAAR